MVTTVPNTRVGCCLGPEGNGVSSGEGVREGQAPQARSEISSQLLARQEATWSRRKKEEESGVTKRTQRAQIEHSQRTFINVFKCY
jgi:hypothetical protein